MRSQLFPRSLRWAQLTSFMAFVVGMIVLSAWFSDSYWPTALHAEWPRMSALAAFGFMLAGATVMLGIRAVQMPSEVAHRWRIARIAAALLGMLGLAALISAALGRNVVLDTFAVERLSLDGLSPHGSTAPATAVGFLLLAASVLFASLPTTPRVSQICAGLLLIVGCAGISRYLYGGIPLLPYSAMAIHTAVLLALLASAAFVLRANEGFVVLFAGKSASSITLRRLLPAAVALPFVFGAGALHGHRTFGFSEEASIMLLAASCASLFAVLVLNNAGTLRRADRQRERALDELAYSEARMRALTESLPHLVWTCRPDGWCDYLSSQWMAYTGIAAAEQVGYGWANQLHPEDRERAQFQWSQAAIRGDVFDIEFRIRRYDGEYRWFKTRAIPLRDSEGRVVKWFGSNTDIEDLKRSEVELRAQLDRLSLLDETTRAIGDRQDVQSIFRVVIGRVENHLQVDFACVCDWVDSERHLRVNSIGPQSAEIGTSLALTEGTRLDVDPADASRWLTGQLIYDADTAQAPFLLPSRFAQSGFRSVIIAPLMIERRPLGIMLVARRAANAFEHSECEFMRQLSQHVALAAHHSQLYTALQRAYDDLQETQRAVVQHERLGALGQMASGIAHDINNALSPAALYTQIILSKDSTLSASSRQHLEIIHQAIEDVASTVRRMRQFYRPQDGASAQAPVDLNEIVRHVIELTRARWHDMPQERGIVVTVETDLAENLPAALGDEAEIRDAVTNLVLNAVDAMPTGGVLSLRTVLLGQTNRGPLGRTSARGVQLEVCDTGVGMDEVARNRCFEPFFTTKGERGTGLGLAMVYGMVVRHNAEIDVESAPGRGTVMRLTFRTLAAQDNDGFDATIVKPCPPRRILLVDDDPIILDACRNALEGEGHAVQVAKGGQAGMDVFRSASVAGASFDIVITDLGMPYVDGRQVAALVKSTAPATPVVMLTGWGHHLDVLPENVDAVLSKPPVIAELRSVLADLSIEA